MNYTLLLCAFSLGLGATARADALDKNHIAPNAKWLVHIDCDNLRQTQVGDYLLKQFVIPKATAAMGDLKLNVSNLLQQVHSLTAYGSDFKKGPQADGVLLINCSSDTQKALEGLLAAQILANTNGPVKKLAGDDAALYSFANQVFISPFNGGPIIVSKSQEEIDAARERLAGKAPSLSSSSSFISELPLVGNSFVVLGAADVLNGFDAIPAQAKVLQMADGGRVALGERSDQVYLDLALRGKTVEVTHQIQQVIEGMVALVNLGQPDYPDVMDLAKSVKVSTQDRVVTVTMEYPASKVIAKVNEAMTPKPHTDKPSHHKVKSKNKPKQEAHESSAPTVPPGEEELKPAE